MVVYIEERSMIFTVKCLNNMFFYCLWSALVENHDLYCSVILWNCTWYCTGTVFFHCSFVSWGL